MWKTALAAAAVLLLAACAVPRPQSAANWQPQRGSAGFSAVGRLSAQKDGTGFHASFDWNRQNGVETIDINTPLGNTVGSLCQDRLGALAVDAAGRRSEAADARQLSGRLLGVTLPVEYLRVWAHGQWVEGVPHQILPDGSLRQQEWTVRRSLNAAGGIRLLEVAGNQMSLRLVFDSMETAADDAQPPSLCAVREAA
ncbi:outer membrane lipoprotein LolB [Neisseria leonii]|uniref:outer membrane lipoprotein LolB n=1 Tax=Neisseria leonii TaxID=2995413 RepID=UPI00237BDB1C|nr:outer membrane lipoprotein LolB [Neisseria sp. 3986]MDD9324996.1 outer membrane lipoprotein LolB [Neisseria sp. 3986]